uniref:Uncharacterized protein n=1 Tax=Ascaris lumbricoides TaxID=6252 RepID=A0A0M3HV13_ASCLU
MGLQQFQWYDYLAPLCMFSIFCFTIFVISFACLNFCCVELHEDLTVFEEVCEFVGIRLSREIATKIMGLQQFQWYDYLAPLCMFSIFCFTIFVISFACLNFCCVELHEDLTVFEEWGLRRQLNVRMGPHPTDLVKEIEENNQRTLNGKIPKEF